MKVRIERRGGLAGVTARGERDMAALTPAQHEALDLLIHRHPASQAAGADRFSYRLDVLRDDGSVATALALGEDEMPDSLAGIAQIEF